MPDDDDRSILTRRAPPPDEVVTYGAKPEHVADVRYGRDGGDRPLVLFVHGGFWKPKYDRSHAGPAGAAVAVAGWTSAVIEYRRTPGDPDATHADVAAALRMVPSLVGRHDGRTIVAGHSAGGHLALWCAATSAPGSLSGVLALAPVADLCAAERMALGDDACRNFLGRPALDRPDLDPVRLPPPTVPTVVVHGATDSIVPIELSRSYVRMHAGARLVVAPGGHFGVIDPVTSAFATVLDELARLADS